MECILWLRGYVLNNVLHVCLLFDSVGNIMEDKGKVFIFLLLMGKLFDVKITAIMNCQSITTELILNRTREMGFWQRSKILFSVQIYISVLYREI